LEWPKHSTFANEIYFFPVFFYFQENPQFLNQIEKAKLFREYAQNFANHRHHPRTMKSIAVFRLLAIGILKATPAFPKLTIAEKATQLAYLLNIIL
jgi:uncharacterized membrane protein YbaN (DUF454 family)